MMATLQLTIAALLAMSSVLASAEGASPSLEERLQKLEAEQAAMKQQLAERDAVIQELKRELAAQSGTTAPKPNPTKPNAILTMNTTTGKPRLTA